MKSYNLRNQSVTLTKNQYNQNMEQFLSWFIGPWSQTLIFQNSSFCSFFYISYPTIWGIWNWIEFRRFLRLEEIKEIPHCVGFLAQLNPSIWGIWTWNGNWIFLRLKEDKDIPHFVGFLAHQNPSIWGVWNWIVFRMFLRLEEIKEIPHSVGFLVHQNHTVWGIRTWNEN